MTLEEWGRGRLADLVAITDAVLPGEKLTPDELEACCWDDPGAVLGTAGDEGAVSAAVHGDVGWVKLVAVMPSSQGTGLGRALLTGAQDWCFDHDAREVHLGDAAPFYLWPGVDVRFTRMLCLAESLGYEALGANLNMSCPTTFRSKPPDGVTVERVLGDELASAALAFAERAYPWWVAELQRAIDHASAFAGCTDGGDVVGFACHSVNRAGWVGPMATDPASQHRGVGGALLGELCRDLMVAGFPDAEIAWVGPVGFYARTAGAAVSRVFRTARLRKR